VLFGVLSLSAFYDRPSDFCCASLVRGVVHTLVLLAVGALTLNGARADTLKSDGELRPFADSVMAKVGSGDLVGAFALMKPYASMPGAEFDATALNSRAQRDMASTRFGAAAGYEFIGESKVGQSLLRFTYIEKTERHALSWQFYFYRSPDGWLLNGFLWHDQVQTLFGTAR
jgi:hypothetical protein